MTLTHSLVRHLSPLLRITMKDISHGRSPYHTAVSSNMKEAINGNYPDQHINPHKVILSKGDLTAPASVKAKRTDEGMLLEWCTDNHSEGYNSSSDNTDLVHEGFGKYEFF